MHRTTIGMSSKVLETLEPYCTPVTLCPFGSPQTELKL